MTKTLTAVPVSVMSDFYKITHRLFYPENTTEIYSTWTPRSSFHFPIKIDYAVAFGFQMFVKKYLINYFNEHFFSRPVDEVVGEYEYVIENTLGGIAESKHIRDLHQLGYLPLEIKALPEGTLVPMKVPTLTIHNTLPEFFWLTNYFETIMSSELWLPSNSATVAYHYRNILDAWALETTDSTEGVDFQGHDFSFRGMQGLDSSISSGMGHLLSFLGTDNIPAIVGTEMYYNTKLSDELVGTSVKATEHSIMSAYGRDELSAFNTIIDKVPEGIVSIVSDTYDFWNVLETVIPTLKDKIMSRDGKVVLRPDSGKPIDIICGDLNIPSDLVFESEEETPDNDPEHDYVKSWLIDHVRDLAKEDCDEPGTSGASIYEIEYKFKNSYYRAAVEVDYDRFDKQYYYPDEVSVLSIDEFEPTSENKGAIEMLWDIFGGTITDQGYKILDSHIGLLYGDAITLNSVDEIFSRLEKKGFASTNLVVGIGSFSYTYNTRDSLGYALKATYAEIDGKETFIQKDPKTDKDNLKKSLTGKVVVVDSADGLKVIDHLTTKEEEDASDSGENLLVTIFKDGETHNEMSFKEIKEKLYGK